MSRAWYSILVSAKKTAPPAGGAVTIEYESRVSVLQTDIDVREPTSFTVVDVAGQRLRLKGIWDTGASATAISQNVVTALGLNPTGMKREVHTANGIRKADTYAVSLHLPQGVITNPVLAVDVDLITGADVLIGMDVIGTGDFAVTHSGGRTKLSFCVPSMHDTDYYQMTTLKFNHDRARNQPKRVPRRKRRN